MRYADYLRKLFPGIELRGEDLFLLEAFQVKYLPDRVPVEEFAMFLHANPRVQDFLTLKYPPVADFIRSILSDHPPAASQDILRRSSNDLLWEIADLIIYNKYPEVYDEKSGILWDISELNTITSFQGKIVVDAGAGTGRLAFLVSPFAEAVFAVEPVTGMRRFIRNKALGEKVNNLYALDGFLDAIPFPASFVDVLMTSNAIGWNLEGELFEIERVVKPGGFAIHLMQTEDAGENPVHETLVSQKWGYSFKVTAFEKGQKRMYWKAIDDPVA
jgi:SAM-dependent methyltransferase